MNCFKTAYVHSKRQSEDADGTFFSLYAVKRGAAADIHKTGKYGLFLNSAWCDCRLSYFLAI